MYGFIIYMYNVGQNLLTGSIVPLQMYYKHINLSYIYIYIYNVGQNRFLINLVLDR